MTRAVLTHAINTPLAHEVLDTDTLADATRGILETADTVNVSIMCFYEYPGYEGFRLKTKKKLNKFWRSGKKHIAIGAGGVGFDSRAGQIGHSVTYCSPRLRCCFGIVFPKRKAAEMGPATRCSLRRNTASIMKI